VGLDGCQVGLSVAPRFVLLDEPAAGGHVSGRGLGGKADGVEDAAAEKIAENNNRFREANERIALVVEEEGLSGEPMPFICECSDRRCFDLLLLLPDDYARVRSNPRWFLHAPGHEPQIEGAVRLVETHEQYLLVEKIGHAGEVAAELEGQEGEE
jgi:hypothetical protein